MSKPPKKAKRERLYSFDYHPEHKAQLKEWNDKRGIAVALDCTPMDDEDKEICRAAVKGMYEAAGLVAPPPERIVFVSSPFVARLAGGFAAATWWLRKNPNYDLAKMSEFEKNDAIAIATSKETNDETRKSTYNLTSNATYNAIYLKTHILTYKKTHNATDISTRNVTRISTYNETRLANYNKTDDETQGATYLATRRATNNAKQRGTNIATVPEITAPLPDNEKVLVGFFHECAKSALNMWQGGNEWAGWGSYISFFRDIAKLDLPEYQNWKHWEALELHSGIRIVHKDFCIISDRPEFIKMNEYNRPHCVDGPFKKYRDGWSLYYINGVAVDRELTES